MSSNASQRPKAAASLGPVTDDAFLGGHLQILQPLKGFRSGLDAVMLAAAVPAKERQRICDLGAAVGTAGFCVAARVSNLHLTAVEIDPELAALADANFLRNDLKGTFEVIVADVLTRPRNVPRQSFHHVLTNPPFYDSAKGTVAPEQAKARAKSFSESQLATWLKFARALVKPKGTLTVILPPAQLSLALATLTATGQGAEIIPLWPKACEPAKRVIVRVQMNSKAALRLYPGLILHGGFGTPSIAADAILRSGKALTT